MLLDFYVDVCHNIDTIPQSSFVKSKKKENLFHWFLVVISKILIKSPLSNKFEIN